MGQVLDLPDIEEVYEVMEQVGDGGQADLYAGCERSSGRKVALKIQKERGFEPSQYFKEVAQGFEKEGGRTQTLAGVRGIPEVFAIGYYRERRCIALEFIEGKLLFDSTASARPVKDLGTIASVAGQLCEILDGVHRLNIVHRDLKPENVMVEPDGRIRLLDLGMAISANEDTEEGCGTIGYVPPEQLDRNTAGVTGRADIFALGCILLEMTVMQLPYGGTRTGLLQEGFPVLPPDRLADLPPALGPLMLRMVERLPERRPADVREVFAALRPHLPVPGSARPRKPLRPDPTEYYRTNPPRL
jgi:serine/threonine-protein kinase